MELYNFSIVHIECRDKIA